MIVSEDTVWRGACGLAFGWCVVLALAHWWVSGVSCIVGSCVEGLQFVSVFVLALTSVVLLLVGLGLTALCLTRELGCASARQ